MASRGQAIVEFALSLPILLFMMLGFAEAAFMFAERDLVQRSANVLADVAASKMAIEPGESWQAGWNSLVAQEAANAGCDLVDSFVTFPDETHNEGDRVRVQIRCRYHTRIMHDLWPGLILMGEGTSVVRS